MVSLNSEAKENLVKGPPEGSGSCDAPCKGVAQASELGGRGTYQGCTPLPVAVPSMGFTGNKQFAALL